MSTTRKSSNSGEKKDSTAGEGPIPLNLMRALRRKANSESGSSSEGNNSEDSALISLGNTSFGFNFDSEEGMSSSNNPRENSEEDDGNGPVEVGIPSKAERPTPTPKRYPAPAPPALKSSTSSLTTSSNTNSENTQAAHHVAAANAVASLQSIAETTYGNVAALDSQQCNPHAQLRKRKSMERSDNESGGYNTDDDEENSGVAPMMIGSNSNSKETGHKAKKKKKANDRKRQERNAREKERSSRISQQINDLRNVLSGGGVIVPKGTKSSVLTEAANYIRMLQQHQYKSEIDRQQLVQQMQLIGGGAHGQQAASVIRHVAAQNGVWSLGNFGGVPPKSAMTFYQAGEKKDDTPKNEQKAAADVTQLTSVGSPDYRFVFNFCGVGMAIASMGGAFIDCNHLFSQLSNYTKQELCSLTIFNLTARQDLQTAFDQISQLISSPMSKNQDSPKPIVLRGSMKDRDDLGLSVSLVRGDDGIAKCFCVTLIKNPSSPYDSTKPTPVSFDDIKPRIAGTTQTMTKDSTDNINSAPAFTSG